MGELMNQQGKLISVYVSKHDVQSIVNNNKKSQVIHGAHYFGTHWNPCTLVHAPKLHLLCT